MLHPAENAWSASGDIRVLVALRRLRVDLSHANMVLGNSKVGDNRAQPLQRHKRALNADLSG